MTDKIAFTNDYKQIIALWSRVFGDTEEDIRFFLDNCVHKSCLGYFSGNALVSMLFLVECTYCGRNGAYIYAVCTDEKFRGRGYVSELIEKSKKENYDFLWLIPADDSLFGFYEQFEFKTKLFSDKKYDYSVAFDEKRAVREYLYEGSSYDYPKGMMYSRCDLPIGGTGFEKNI